jgi:GT2 family glycosyltransferase
MTPYTNVGIIIVNWNGIKHLNGCFTSLFKQTYDKFQIYFVDNGSSDGSIDYVMNNYPETRIIALKSNTGYAKGNNIGITEALKNSGIEYIVCLNNDTVVKNNWLNELVKTATSKPKIGAVSSKAYFLDNITIQNAGLIYSPAISINKPGGISLGYGLTDKQAPELSDDIEIFAPGGIAPLYTRQVLHELISRDKEVFDEDFFSYGEDLDLGFRIRSLGYKCYLSSNAKLIHLHSQTLGVASPLKAYYGERNAHLIALKNFPISQLIMYPFKHLIVKIDYIFKKHESVTKLKNNIGYTSILVLSIKAFLSALSLAPKFIRKRQLIKNEKYTNS